MIRKAKATRSFRALDGCAVEPAGLVRSSLASFRRVALLALTATAALLALAPSAFAAFAHTYTSSFGASGTAESQFGTSSPNGSAFDQSTGALYVTDTANSRIEKFQADGTFVSAWGWGVQDGTAASQVCTSGCQAGISGSGAGQLATPTFVAVDNSATSASQGDVYVADTTNNTVSKFDSSGNYLSTNDGTASGSAFGSLAGVAVNSGGDLWAYDTNADMRKFAENGSFLTQWNSGFGVTQAGIAVDSTDHLYIVRGFPAVEKLDDTGTDLGELDGSGTATGLTVGGADLYVTQGDHVARFDTGCALPDCSPTETFGSLQITAATGLAVRGSDSRAYVSDAGNTEVDIFDFTNPPTATTNPATTVHHTDAVLNGHLDPGGDPSISNCQFDYVDDAQFQIDGFTSAANVPCTPGPPYSGPADVTANLGGLTPGTTYHFRLDINGSVSGDVPGNDLTFTPPPFPVVAPELAAFGPDGTSGTGFSNLGPLALDPSLSHLYALDKQDSKVYSFDASTPATPAPLGPPFPLAVSNAGGEDDIATDPASHRLYYVSESDSFTGPALYGFDSAGNPLAGFPVGVGGDSCGTAVDSSGNVWLGDYNAKLIREFDPSGNPIGSVDTSAQAGSNGPCHIAFDSNDDLYVALFRGTVWKYTAASGYSSGSATEIDSGDARALAVDPSTHDLYVAHADKVSEYDSAGHFLGDFATGIAAAEFAGVAVDATNHDVYLSDRGNHKVRVFGAPATQRPPTITPGDPTAVTATAATLNAKVDPETFQVTDCHFDYVTDAQFQIDQFASATSAFCDPDAASIGDGSGDVAVHADLSGLDVGTTYHFRIVASNAQPGGTATGPDQTLTTLGPSVSGTSATLISDTAAKLNATVNPNGEPTTWHFEYGSQGPCDSHPCTSTPVPDASAGQGTDPVPFSRSLTGLQPGTIYHFRFLATSTSGTTLGPDATFTTYAAPQGFAPCPNDALRSAPGDRLPDCRAYEQASPVDKHGASARGSINFSQASTGGDRITFAVPAGLPTTGGASRVSMYVASRAGGVWNTNGLLPPTTPGNFAVLVGLTGDLATSLSVATTDTGGGLFLGDTAAGTWAKVADAPAEIAGFNQAFLAGSASDPSHLLIQSAFALANGAIAGNQNLYDLDHGAVTLAGMVPAFPDTTCNDQTHLPADCVAPAGGSFAGPYDFLQPDLNSGGASGDAHYYTENTLSADGSKVFFTEGGTGRLYIRDNNTATTQISASQKTNGGGPGGIDSNGHKPAAWMASTPTGSKVFFTSCEQLTDLSTAVSTGANDCTTTSQGQDLYSYDTGTGDLTDLTVDTNSDPLGADVQGLLGASPDGSDLYFAANGDLDGAGPATLGDCTGNGGGGTGTCNLYLSHNGAITFVTRVDAGLDRLNWLPSSDPQNGRIRTSRVAADGTLLLSSPRQLTAYDNAGKAELYRYRPGDPALLCVSCNPTGARPIDDAKLTTRLPTATDPSESNFLTRNLSGDGNRVFFDSADPLVAADHNGDQGCPVYDAHFSTLSCVDAYEWEADGTGSCHSHAQDGGCLYLLSTGQSPDPSFFADASASGDDAFFFTSSRLAPQDQDQLTDVYDASVGGGLQSQHSTPPPPCSGDACHGDPTPPPPPPGFQTGTPGPGNQGKNRGGTATTTKKKCHKHKNKHKKRCRKARRANANRGGAK